MGDVRSAPPPPSSDGCPHQVVFGPDDITDCALRRGHDGQHSWEGVQTAPPDTLPPGAEALAGLRQWSYTLETGSRVRGLIERTERAETALRRLWSSLAWTHQDPHSADCLVCRTYDEVRQVLRRIDD